MTRLPFLLFLLLCSLSVWAEEKTDLYVNQHYKGRVTLKQVERQPCLTHELLEE